MALFQSAKRSMFHLNESDLFCKNQCGFYGNPEWHGLCSKCFREYQKNADSVKSTKSLKDVRETAQESLSVTKKPSNSSIAPFDRFVSKKKQHNERKTQTIKSLFSGNKEADNAPPKLHRQVSADVQAVVKELNEFLQTLPKPSAVDIANRVQSISKKVSEISSSDFAVDDLSKIVNNFYEDLWERLKRHDLYAGMDDATMTRIMDYVESYIIIRNYKVIFCPVTSDDEEKDLMMQNRIRKLNWVTPNRLGIVLDEISLEVREELDAAITQIIEVDSKKTVEAKLNSVVGCCKHIASLISLSGNGPASADQFLPAFIYIILRANPPRLQSNIKFVTRFANPNRLRTGEAGYFFTMLCCAVSFIDNMDAKSLEMTEEEYQEYMSGSASRTSLADQEAFMSEGFRQMSRNMEILAELRQRQERLIENIQEESRTMENFYADCQRRLKECQEKYPVKIRPRKNVMDSEETESGSGTLPAPLQPVSVSPVSE